MRPLKAVWTVLAALLLAGCAAEPPEPFRISATQPRKAAVADVPLIRQAAYYCGPTALAMVMGWAGERVTPEALARLSFSPGARGTYGSDMIGAARRHGFLAVPITGLDGLISEVDAGNPVIVFQNLGVRLAPVWHYAVLVGYDLDRGEVRLHSGERDVMVMPLDAFLTSWRGGDLWALAVLPPDRLPVSPGETAMLSAAAGLERAGRPEAAAKAYRSGAARWPDSWLWSFGRGNALYATGDLGAAERAFARAARLAPDAPEPRQNLAEVRRQLGGG